MPRLPPVEKLPQTRSRRRFSAGDIPCGNALTTDRRAVSKFSHTVRRIIEVPAISAASRMATPMDTAGKRVSPKSSSGSSRPVTGPTSTPAGSSRRRPAGRSQSRHQFRPPPPHAIHGRRRVPRVSGDVVDIELEGIGAGVAQLPRAFEPAAIPAVVFTDPEIAWAGVTEDQAKREGRKVSIAYYPWAASGRAQAIGSTEGMTKWIIDPETDRVLGVHIIGTHASELIGQAVLAMEFEASSEDIARTVFAHPTLSEALHEAALGVDGRAIHIGKQARSRQ